MEMVEPGAPSSTTHEGSLKQGGTTHDTRRVLWRNRQAVRPAFCRHQHGGDGIEFAEDHASMLDEIHF